LVKELSVKGHNSFIYFNLDNQFTYACFGSCASKSMAIEKSNALKEAGIAVWLYSVR
jgi:hypothetical protein